MMEQTLATAPGLRESNKARTRLAIAAVATQLFIEHGFEHVTVAQIAAEAQVSVKTVFNYFSSKEELFFDRAEDLLDALLDAVRGRPPGTTVLEALRSVLSDRRVLSDDSGWAPLRDPEHYEAVRRFLATERAAPALRARRLLIAEQWTEPLADLFTGEFGLGRADRAASELAAMVIGVLGLRERELSAAMMARLAPRTVERRVRAVVDEGFARLARAFADLDG